MLSNIREICSLPRIFLKAMAGGFAAHCLARVAQQVGMWGDVTPVWDERQEQ
jgi:hypothetical protein